MTLHPLAERFAAVADSYDRGRPEYAPAVVGALAAELGLQRGAAVIDLAAGTGRLTRALLAAGLDVLAVEPQAPLRELLIAHVGAGRVFDGRAEAMPFPDASAEAVTVGDAFHWFDQAAAVAEIRRVLRPGGGLAVLTTIPDWSGASWAHEVGALMERARPEHPQFDGAPWQSALEAAGGWGPPREVRVTSAQPATAERVLDYIASVSWVAGMPEEQRGEMLSRVAALVAAGETPSTLPVHVVIGLAQLA